MNELLGPGRPIRKFNPGTFQSDEELSRQFVVRERELGIVLEVLHGNVGAPSCQHVLLVAPRGLGKTMLLARVAAELRTNREFSERLLPVRFMEESQEIFNMGDFWLETLFHLAREIGKNDPESAREIRDTHADLAARWRGKELEGHARAAALEATDRTGKQIVLMVENLQTLCGDVDADFGWKLRKTLQSEPRIILLATATSRFKGLDNAKEPFFELFRIICLEALDTEECRRLWQVVSGDTVSGREIRSLEILTGGNPRLLVIVAGFAQHRSLRQLMENLVSLIDDHTEYFRSHLAGFAKTERRVYLSVIDLRQPSSTGEIAARARMDVRTVSTLLGRLVNRGAVIVEGRGKKRLYAAAERLYSIYYKLRRERDEAAVVRNMVLFLVVFYTDDEMTEMFVNLNSEAMQSSTIREGIERAVAETPQLGKFFPNMARSSIEKQSKQTNIYDEVVERFGDSDAPELQEQVAMALVNKGVRREQLGETDAAIALYDEAVERFGDSDVPELQVLVAMALFNKGVRREQLGETDAAIALYDEVVERFGDNEAPELQVLVAMALVNKGVRRGQLGETDAAIALYDEVAERFGDSDAPELQVQVAMALVNKGVTRGQLGETDAAIALYDEVAERFGDGEAPELQKQVAKALVNKGVTRGQLGDAEAEIAVYDEVAERFGDSDAPELQEQVAKALVNKGVRRGQLGETDAAITVYDEVAERFGDGDAPELQEQVAMALVYKGVTRGQLEETDAAIAVYDEVVERFGDSDAPELQEQVAKALFNKGVTRGQLGDVEAEIAVYDEVVERFGDSDAPELQEQVAKVLFNKGVTRGQLGETDAAIAVYDEVVERFGDSDAPELQEQVAKALFNKGVRRGQLGETDAAITVYDEVAERFGDGDAPELQEQVAMALVYKGVTRGQLEETDAAIAVYDEVVERFGDSDAPELQKQVAKALVNKGVTRGQLEETEAAIAVYDEVVERFGDSDAPELQEQVAKALVNKGVTRGQLGETDAAIAVYDEVVERFGDSDAPELQVVVATALVNKGKVQIDLHHLEEALNTSEVLERKYSALIDDNAITFEWRAKWIKMKVSLAQGRRSDSMETFRSIYASFVPGNRAMVRQMLDLIAVGALERDLIDVLSSDRKKSDALEPLIVALRQRIGETVRAPIEVLEIAQDVRQRIEEVEKAGGTTTSGRTK